MEKHVAVLADFPDAPYIEQAGLWSAAMQRAHFVWCQTTASPRRGWGRGRSCGFRREKSLPPTPRRAICIHRLAYVC